MRFQNRTAAGRKLAGALASFAGRPDAIVLALPRGGVPVAYAVAQALGLQLDIILVRKIGLPGHEEYAIGAVASGAVRVLNPDVFAAAMVTDAVLATLCERQLATIAEREEAYRCGRPPPDLHGRVAILIDDGLATGSTMRAAVAVARNAGAARVVAALPVGAPESCAALEAEVDELVCLSRPPRFRSVGQWYADFDQTDDATVKQLLAQAWARDETAPAHRPAPAATTAETGADLSRHGRHHTRRSTPTTHR